MDLKWPLSRGSQFKLHFYLGEGETEDCTKVSTSLFFSKDCWLIIPRYKAFNRNKMHGNPTRLEIIRQHYDSKIRISRDYLVNRLFLQKIKLRWPLSKGSHFNIYFRLGCRENRRSCQSFHEIPFFSKTVYLINPDHYVTLQIYYHLKLS